MYLYEVAFMFDTLKPKYSLDAKGAQPTEKKTLTKKYLWKKTLRKKTLKCLLWEKTLTLF